ncbi:MAG: hypothetical protein ABIY51_15970 [Ferruginibacter sp.]
MIEQTALVVSKWDYHAPADPNITESLILENTILDVMKKTAATKKGIACRFSTYFTLDKKDILEFVAENTYVIDFDEVIAEKDLFSMIRNTYKQVKETFDVRKLGTILQERSLNALDESKIDINAILPMVI